jgi:hypothetical protein
MLPNACRKGWDVRNVTCSFGRMTSVPKDQHGWMGIDGDVRAHWSLRISWLFVMKNETRRNLLGCLCWRRDALTRL